MSWKDYVRKVEPYVPGEQPKRQDVIKLNTNENPYPPSPMVKKVLGEMDTALLRKYPDPKASILVNAIAEAYKIDPGQVFVGVGSDDVLAMCFMTFFNSTRPVLFADVTYSFYDVWCDVFRIPYKLCPLDANFRLDPRDYDQENGGCVIANPNAPTGELLSLEQIEDILIHNQDVTVIVDEAYIDFGGQSALPLLNKYENLLVVQTFSKSRAMAGMRIGYAFGSREMIRCLNDVKYSFNSYTMNQTALLAGEAVLKDQAYFEEIRGKIIATRERTKKKMAALGFAFGDSMSNFLFVTHPKLSASGLFEALKEAGIYVRYWNKPRISNYLRITIGTDEEMDRLFEFLEKYIEERV